MITRLNLASALLALGALLATVSCGGGGGGGDTTPIGGGGLSPFRPTITVPATETYRDLSSAGDTEDERWLKNFVETLPAEGSPAGLYQNVSLRQWADIIFAGVNSERSRAGLPALTFEPHLALAAQAHARDMALRNFFAHDNPDGMTTGNRMYALNCPDLPRWTENAAKGQESAAEVVSGWMASEKHREHILDGEVTHLGVGVYYDPADRAMPVHVIADFASFYSPPGTHQGWYRRGDVNR